MAMVRNDLKLVCSFFLFFPLSPHALSQCRTRQFTLALNKLNLGQLLFRQAFTCCFVPLKAFAPGLNFVLKGV